TDSDSKQPLNANIILREGTASAKVLQKTTNNPTNGGYEVIMTAGKKYVLEVTAAGHSTYRREFNLMGTSENKQFLDDISLFPTVKLALSTVDQEYYFPVNSDLSIIELSTGQVVYTDEKSPSKTNYNITLPVGKLYKVNINSKNYSPKTFSLDLRKNVLYRDLYKEAELVPIKKKVNVKLADSESGTGMDLDLLITNLDTEEEFTTSASVGRDGKYALNLREGNKYNIQVKTPKGYAFSNTKVTIMSGANKYEVDISLIAIKPGAKLLLKEIYFEYNSPELYEDSFEELVRVIGLMREYPNMVVEIDAHTDDVGNDQFNQKLSEKRASYVANFITQKDIPHERLLTKGFGESVPLVPNDSDANRMRNRRLELRVIKI
ncbi:MAG: OmpA family protein, partial [Cytophagales bacterium]|nr:OmpA family protein [Cytophagales bacterium]